MSKIEFKPEITPAGETVLVASITAELVSQGSNPIPNKNGNEFYPVTIKFENALGNQQSVPALLYKGNADYGVEKGVSYLTKIIASAGSKPLFIMSHLARGTEASLADLGLNMEDFQSAGVIQDFNKVPKK
jgi:hypothetical protein